MIDHTGIGVADVAVSAAFYDAVLGALGLKRVAQLPPENGADAIGYGFTHPVFWIDRFHPHSTRNQTAFVARSRDEVIAFHRSALAAGGQDNGEPRYREAEGYEPSILPTKSTGLPDSSRRPPRARSV